MFKKIIGRPDEENHFLQEDYPYGRRLRCQRKNWIEHNRRGSRWVTQTQDPRNGRWNRPKASTYQLWGFLYLDENQHVQFFSISGYSYPKDLLEAQRVVNKYQRTFSDDDRALVNTFVEAHKIHNPEAWWRHGVQTGEIDPEQTPCPESPIRYTVTTSGPVRIV